ncbi:hypothetical protein JCM10207_007787 [Rhodosporidiobolus poonsookiae]
MSAPPTGECLMCGAESNQRCSACGAAELDLFFCSTEHQKLLWPVHRDVCGAQSNPFQWPPLSKEEVEDAVEHMHVRPKHKPVTLCEYIVQISGCTKDDVPSFLEDHTGKPWYTPLVHRMLATTMLDVLTTGPSELSDTQAVLYNDMLRATQRGLLAFLHSFVQADAPQVVGVANILWREAR